MEVVKVMSESVAVPETNVVEAVVEVAAIEAVTNVVEIAPMTTNVIETVSEVTNVVENVSEATNAVENISEPVIIPEPIATIETNVEARVEPEAPVAKPEPPAVEPTPPVVKSAPSVIEHTQPVIEPKPLVVEPAPPVLRASVSPCEISPNPPVEKVPQRILISATGLDAKVYGFLLRKFYRNRDVSVRRGEAKGEIVVTARTYEPVRAALSERFAVEETDATHWNVREKPREYAFSMRFFCESREEFDALRTCLMCADVPFAVEILSSPNGDARWLDATVTFRSPDGKVPDARRCVADFLLKSGVDGERANWLSPNKIRSIQKL